MNIYSNLILDHYKNPRNCKKLECPTIESALVNPSCGDSVHVQVIVVNGCLQELSFIAKGCAISVAAASLLSVYVKGKSVQDVLRYDASMINTLLGTELGPVRMKCALLSLQALQETIGLYGKK